MCKACEIVWKAVLKEREVNHLPWGRTFLSGMAERLKNLNDGGWDFILYRVSIYDSGCHRNFMGITTPTVWRYDQHSSYC